MHALPGTWNDKNGNFEFDAKDGEARKAWEIGAAVTHKKEGGKTAADDGRAFVLGDSDGLGDGVIGMLGNAQFLVDTMKWLVGDEGLVGETTSEVDVPIAHTKGQDAWWFYSTIFLAPAVVLAVGWFATRRRPRKRPRA